MFCCSVSSEENYSEEDFEEMNLVVDMVVSHSAYLNILFGPKSWLKKAMVELLISLAPASCRQDQVDYLLAGYTGTFQLLHSMKRNYLFSFNRSIKKSNCFILKSRRFVKIYINSLLLRHNASL